MLRAVRLIKADESSEQWRDEYTSIGNIGPETYSLLNDPDHRTKLVKNKYKTPDQRFNQVMGLENYAPKKVTNVVNRQQKKKHGFVITRFWDPVKGIKFYKKGEIKMAEKKKGFSLGKQVKYNYERSRVGTTDRNGKPLSDFVRGKYAGKAQGIKQGIRLANKARPNKQQNTYNEF